MFKYFFKKTFIYTIAVSALFLFILPLNAEAATKISKPEVINPQHFFGRFVIQTPDNVLWFIAKEDGKRFSLKNSDDLNWFIQNLAKEISDEELKLIRSHVTGKKVKEAEKYYGNLVYSTKATSSIWYVNPADGIRYPVRSFGDFFNIQKIIGKKLTKENINKFKLNEDQITYDPAFCETAYVGYNGKFFFGQSYSDKVLSLASLTKLMTALVLEDIADIDWNKTVTITEEQINYPYKYAEKGQTSEIALRAGDQVSFYDLWTAMLTASSNQSSVILADNSGLGRKGFIEAMNQKAKSLGLKKTVFYDMSGLDPDNVSTAREFAIIAKEAFENPAIAYSTQINNYFVSVKGVNGINRNIPVTNRNYSLLAMGADASKTGFLIEAQRNVALKKNGSIYIVMHALSTAQRNTILSKLFKEPQLSYNK